MTARQKIEGLTHSWYGYAVFTAVLSLWNNGIGLISLFLTGVWFLFSIFGVWLIGRRLISKGSLTRALLLCVTGLLSVLGTFATVKMGWTFLHTLSLSVALQAAATAIGVYMFARSFKVLTDSSVKAYFNAT